MLTHALALVVLVLVVVASVLVMKWRKDLRQHLKTAVELSDKKAQLESANRALESLSKKHEELFLAYKSLRGQLEDYYNHINENISVEDPPKKVASDLRNALKWLSVGKEAVPGTASPEGGD